MAEAERLGHPDQGVVDRLVAVRVVALHHLADDRRALDVAAVGRDVQVVPHRVQDPPLHRLEAVADVGQGARRDHAQRVVQVARPRRLGQRDVLDHRLRRPLLRPRPRSTAFPLRHRSFPSAFAASSDADRASVPTRREIPFSSIHQYQNLSDPVKPSLANHLLYKMSLLSASSQHSSLSTRLGRDIARWR